MKSLLLVFIILSHTLISQTNYDAQGVSLLDNWIDTTVRENFYNARFNEVWGFERSGEEYAIIGSTEGMHLFHIQSDKTLNLIWEERMTTTNAATIVHRDFHDFGDYLYAGCAEALNLYRYDLSYLPDSIHNDTLYPLHGIHNLFIDEAESVIYIDNDYFGTASKYEITPSGDINSFEILNLPYYAHDFYARNDTLFANCGSEGMLIIDYNAPSPVYSQLQFYPDKGYNHSGWLSDDGLVYALADETVGTRIKLCDVSDFSDIQILSLIDIPDYEDLVVHNLIMKDTLLFVSYYEAGLQVFDISDPTLPQRIAYFDTYSLPNQGDYSGAWGVYPFLTDNNVLVSDMQSGLFLLEVNSDVLSSSSPHVISGVSVVNTLIENNELLYIEKENITTSVSARLYGLNGAMVQSAVLDFGENSISLAELNTGTYIIQFYQNDKLLGSEKVFKK